MTRGHLRCDRNGAPDRLQRLGLDAILFAAVSRPRVRPQTLIETFYRPGVGIIGIELNCLPEQCDAAKEALAAIVGVGRRGLKDQILRFRIGRSSKRLLQLRMASEFNAESSRDIRSDIGLDSQHVPDRPVETL